MSYNYVRKTKPALWMDAAGMKPSKKLPKRLKQVSSGMAKKKRLYKVLRETFLLEHPKCQACQQIGREKTANDATEVHHKFGRRNGNYLRVETWMSICWICHRRIHNEPAWAVKNGFLGSFIT